MKIGIYGQFYHEGSDGCIQSLLHELHARKAVIIIERSYLSILKKEVGLEGDYQVFDNYEDLDTSFDFFFSIGGDGTILRTVLYIRDLGIPVLGINTGRLGFLATIQKEFISAAIDKVFKHDYRIVKRSLLEIQTRPENKELSELSFALNEIAVSRKNTTSMITVATSIDDEYLTSYWADGLIVSTPTGSTGYSLSCGGPVITPETCAFVLTPIAPHNLNARPLVIPDDKQIKLEVSGREKSFLVSLDSRIATLDNETEICIQKAPFSIKMIELTSESFLKTLRKKLLWGEDKRN
ncbi:NAD kinase [Ascidiimonas aurantiaca]|uniref:NAD kinase n=1 Tax=Ascidiimonas aurantiaca TaxID=1685432 RepID=UPI0030ECA45F